MATDFDTARDQYESYRYCYDNGHHQWVQVAEQCYKYWKGEQWDALTKARLTREGRPALTLNVIRSLMRSAVGIQRALRHDVRFTPVYDATVESARVKDAMWLHAQNENKFDFLEMEVYKKGLVMGRAYFDVRVSYDDSMFGTVQIRSPRSQDVILDPSADQYDPDSWPQVFTRRWVSQKDIENLFGREHAAALAHAPCPDWYDYEDSFMAQQMGALPYYRAEALSDTSRLRAHLLLDRQYMDVKLKECFIDMSTGDVSEIPENWDRNRISRVLELTPGVSTTKRKMKTVRWDVTCEGEVLHSEDSPYKHFTTVPFFPDFLDGTTAGMVEDLLDPQQMYNKVSSQELHIINTTANSGYKVKKGALQNYTAEQLEENGAKSGIVIELDDVNNLEKIQPNAVPQGHERLSFKADQVMRSLSGVSNQVRGFAREDVAGEAIELNQAAADINFAEYHSNLHRTKQLVARNTLDCMQTFYTESRTILINRGTALVPDMETLEINQPGEAEGQMLNDVTRGRYSTTLVPSPSRTTMSEADFKLLLQLREKVGIAIPDAMLIELSPANNKAQIIQKLVGESSERQRAMEEAEAAKAQADMAKSQASAEKEAAAARLNDARADKFAVEAASDPDASYERVEQARIATEQKRHTDEMEFKYAQLEETKRKNRQDAALQLTGLEVTREGKNADREAAKQERRPAARREKKPGTKS